ncbi:hypothetical protein [Priestia megaterium]|uniref:hypothetical protein n=1 Tax=Priestia megaterium TaxID=1404 RepID=UPI002E1D852D|nr:hypothetical protein [Priestia megaterium]
MTVLIGLEFANGVMIVADKKTSNLSHSGENLGTYTLNEKVNVIHENLIMGTAGLGIGNDLRGLIRNTLYQRANLPIKEVNQHINDIMSYSYNLFKKVNTHVSYNDLLAFVGGYSKEEKKAFLYRFSSLNDFKPMPANKPWIIASPNDKTTDIIDNYISARVHQKGSIKEIVELLAESIRKVDSPSVSKETFGIVLFYEETEDTFSSERYEFDDKGKRI